MVVHTDYYSIFPCNISYQIQAPCSCPHHPQKSLHLAQDMAVHGHTADRSHNPPQNHNCHSCKGHKSTFLKCLRIILMGVLFNTISCGCSLFKLFKDLSLYSLTKIVSLNKLKQNLLNSVSGLKLKVLEGDVA